MGLLDWMTFLAVVLLMFSFCALHFHTELSELSCVFVYFLLWARVFAPSIAGSWEW